MVKRNFNNSNDENVYTIIDFETANRNPLSACQVGIMKVYQGKIIKEFISLVKPPTFCDNFEIMNVSVHGIEYKDVREAKNFKQIWPKIADFFEPNNIIIAHNANASDLRYLGNLISYYNINIQNFSYICSLELFRKTYKNFYKSFSLINLARVNKIPYNAHNALEDARLLYKIFNVHFGDNYHFPIVCNKYKVKIQSFSQILDKFKFTYINFR